MLRAAVRLISMQGVTATGLREIVAAADAPRGSLQHYFPGGKDQLVTEAIAIAGEVAARRVRRYAAAVPPPTPGDLFAAIAGAWRDIYASRGYAEGCPLAATATDAAAASPMLREALRRALDTWLDALAQALAALGVPAPRTRSLALLMFSTLEGALILARSRQDTQPLDAVIAELRPVLDAARRPGPAARSRQVTVPDADAQAGP